MQNLLLTQIPLEELKTAISDAVRIEFEKIIKSDFQTTNTEYITRNVAAEILGISLVTLNEWTKRNLVPSYRIGSRVRYKREEVMAAVKKTRFDRCL